MDASQISFPPGSSVDTSLQTVEVDSSPLPASLSTLPPELLRHILESTVPRTFHSTTYKDRQAILGSLSLVSKDFRSIAQPLLHEIVRLETKYQFERFLGGTNGAAAKELYFEDFTVSSLVEKVFDHCPNLRSLSILRKPKPAHPLDVSIPYTNLVQLRLFGVKLSKAQCQPFTSLNVLSIEYATLFYNSWLLDPALLPALKALGIVGDFYQGTGPGILRQIGSPQLLRQLESIELNLTLYVLISNLDGGATLSNIAPRSLVKIFINDLQFPEYDSLLSTVYQMRLPTLYMLGVFGRSGTLEHLAGWVSVKVSQTPHRLRSLYFDPAILPTLEDEDTTHVKWQGLQESCERSEIELVYEDQTSESASFVSGEFWRRQKEAQSSMRS